MGQDMTHYRALYAKWVIEWRERTHSCGHVRGFGKCPSCEPRWDSFHWDLRMAELHDTDFRAWLLWARSCEGCRAASEPCSDCRHRAAIRLDAVRRAQRTTPAPAGLDWASYREAQRKAGERERRAAIEAGVSSLDADIESHAALGDVALGLGVMDAVEALAEAFCVDV